MASLPFPKRLFVVLRILALATMVACAFGRCPARAADEAKAEQMPNDNGLTSVFNNAMAAFAAGDYAGAATGLDKVIAGAPAGSKLEPVYYTLGAAYFNLGQYPKAIETLKSYAAKFPGGPHIASADFSLGQACLLAHDHHGAVEAFQTLEANPAYREQALFYEATAQKDAGKLEDAIGTLEKLVAPGLHSSLATNGALQLAGLYAQKKESVKALAMIDRISENLQLLDNVAQFNAFTIETGDALLEKSLPKEALACYRAVRSRADIIALQTNRIADLRVEFLRSIGTIRADPKNAGQYLAANVRLKASLAEETQRLADSQKLPNFEPTLFIRLATCFSQMDQPWEAIVAYDELLRRYPDEPATREPALYGLIVASAGVGREAKTQQLCEQYLKEFAKGPNVESVGYLLGAVALQASDPQAAEKSFGRVLEDQPLSTYRERARFLLANAQFALGEYEKAQGSYSRYKGDFPHGDFIEEATYRTALCAVFAGAYEKAMSLLDDYLKAYPKGEYVPDARYRLAVCLYAASQNDAVISACQAWEKDYEQGPLLGEVLSLEADALAANNDNRPAVETYLRASKAASTDEVSDYAIFAAQKLLQKAGDWDQISEIFRGFLRDHPDRPSAVMAVYWIGKAEAHEGRIEDAKRFIADTIKQYIADPKRDAVEQLLTQLATLCVRKSTPVSTPEPALAGAAAPAPSATVTTAGSPPPADPGAEMDELLGGAETTASPLARARILFAKSELARLRRQPAAQAQNLEKLAASFKPAELSAPLLAAAGDHLLETGRYEQARPFFDELMTAHPKSEFLDYAYNGLGEIAFQRKDFPRALGYFSDAVDKAAAAAKLKDVTVGKAKTLFAMDRFKEAQTLYEQIASTREWRGDATADAVYSLGAIMRQQGKLPEAIVYYQRVYVAYKRFLPWVAKAYVASAECFEQLGKNQEAINTYREMLDNPKLRDFGEAETARVHLQKLGQG